MLLHTHSIIKQKLTTAFTLVECLMVIALIAILFGLALPQFENILLRKKIDRESESLFALINYGHFIATIYHENIILCPGTQLQHLEKNHACVVNWSNTLYLKNTQDKVLRQLDANISSSHMQITWSRKTNFIQWQKDGSLMGSNGTFIISSTSKSLNYQDKIILSPTGKTKLVRGM